MSVCISACCMSIYEDVDMSVYMSLCEHMYKSVCVSLR